MAATDTEAIYLDAATATAVRFAARLHGVNVSDVIARAVRELGAPEQPAPADRWTPIAVLATYLGVTVDGEYIRATRRLVVTSEPLPGQSFTSPSGAARAVVRALNPARNRAQTNGWQFWHVADTGQRLHVHRH